MTQISSIAEISRNTRIVKLPEQQNGVDIVVRVAAVPKLRIIQALDGIPGAGEEKDGKRSWADIKATVVGSIKPEIEIASLGLIEPAFSFGEEREEGKAWWNDLTIENQAFVVQQIMQASGWKGEQPAAAKSFPPGDKGS